MRLQTLVPAAAGLLGVLAIANGLFMLVAPQSWYATVPGVTTTGPFNQHFVRDIGLIFMLIGSSFVTGAAKPRFRAALWAVPTIWLGGHALFHLWEITAGIAHHSAMARDFPAVTLPALIGVFLTLWALKARSASDVRQG